MEISHDGWALIVTDEQINSAVLDMYPNLKVIGCSMTGLDHIDQEECKARGIEIISLKYAGLRDKDVSKLLDDVTSTAEHTFGLMIALARNYKTALNAPYHHRDEYMGHSLKGKKLLLIGGLGRVGKQVHKMAEGFGMDVYVYDKGYEKGLTGWWDRLTGFDWEQGLKNVLSKMDFVSIHVPLPGNEGFFTREMFESMKPSAYFINTARTKVVEDRALIFALENQLIAGAAVDFTDDESLVVCEAWNKNLILTNHIAGVTYEDRKKTSDFIKLKVDNYINQLIINNYEIEHTTDL